MKRIAKQLTMIALAAVALVSCDHDLYDPEYVGELKDALPNFDMKRIIRADVQYGVGCAYQPISIYLTDPTAPVHDDKGVVIGDSLKGEALLNTFLDADGSFTTEIEIPSYAQELYVASNSWAAPHLVRCPIQENRAEAVIGQDTETRAARVRRRIVADERLTEVGPLNTTHGTVTSVVGKWNNYGKPSDPNNLFSSGIYVSDLITSIQKTLWKGASSKPSNLDNSDKVTTTDIVNTTIAKVYMDENGQQHTVDNAELCMTFISENGHYASAMGYYYYPTGNPPTNPNDVEKFLIIPNASIAGGMSYMYAGSAKDPGSDAPMTTNTKIQLLFRNADGTLTSKFPAGYTIGYFLIPDAYRNSTNNVTTTTRVDGTSEQYKIYEETSGILIFKTTKYYYFDANGNKVYVDKFYKNKTSSSSRSTFDSNSYKYFDVTQTDTGGTNGLDYNKTWIYSNQQWNSDRKDHFVALTDPKTGEVIYAVEDGPDKSYDDIIFTISCSPEGAIYDPQRPIISEDGSSVSVSSTKTRGYYTFEDIWSSGGDYDMNDVIVEYSTQEDIKKITKYTTSTNTWNGQTTTTITDTKVFMDKVTITILPRHCGATYEDGFSMQLPETFSTFRSRIKSITLNGAPLSKDDSRYWRTLARQNSNLDGTLIDISSCQPRFTYEFFHDIRNQQEGKGYTLVIQFDEDNIVTKDEWDANRYSKLTDTKAALNENRLKYYYNPYITVYTLSPGTGKSMEIEVHLPLYPFTQNGIPSAGQASESDASWNLWFVSASTAGQTGSVSNGGPYYPFAMDIPYSPEFYPCRECIKISEAYPRFLQWQLDGDSKSDWYIHRAPNKTQPFCLDFSKTIHGVNHKDIINDYD